MKKLFALAVGLVFAAGLSGLSQVAQAAKFVSIGTGGVTGGYYPTGGATGGPPSSPPMSRLSSRCGVGSISGAVWINSILF